MIADLNRIAELERANYAALLPAAQVTPGLEVLLRDTLILNSSPALPLPDSNHACLLQATPAMADAVLDEALAYFQAREVPPAFFISPACAPADWPQRLEARGFVKQPYVENWIAFEHVHTYQIPPLSNAIELEVQLIGKAKAQDFASVFMACFDLPVEMAPVMAHLLEPSIGLPGYYHYLASVDGQLAGCCSLICYQQYGIIGSGGILADQRGGRAAYNLVVQVAREAQNQGVDILLGQTTSGLVARLLRLYGFKTVFTRACYTLDDQSS